jgi:hypothetical protein
VVNTAPNLGKGAIVSVISVCDPIWDPIRGDQRFEKLRSQKGATEKAKHAKKSRFFAARAPARCWKGKAIIAST